MEINKFKKYEKKIDCQSSFFEVFKSLLHLIKEKKIILILGIMFILISNVAIVLVPFFVRNITANIQNTEYIVNQCIYLFLLYLVNCIFLLIGSLILGFLAENITFKLRSRMFEKIVKVKFSTLIDYDPGMINSMISYDIDTINSSITNNLVTIISNTTSIIGALICAIVISPILSIFLIIPVLLSFVRTKYISKIMRKKYYVKSEKLAIYESKLNEWVNARETIEAYGLKEIYEDNILEYNNIYHDAALSAEKYGSSISPFSHLIQHLCLVILSITSLIFLDFGLITIAIYSSFILYSKKFADPIGDLSSAFLEFTNSQASYSRIDEFLNANDYTNDYEISDNIIDSIETLKVRDLSFGYDPNINVLNDISFDMIPKGTLAIVGHTGCGKTTLISLILGLLTKKEGEILINDVDINEIDKISYQNNISYVSQEPWIFKGTILENLTYGNENYDINMVEFVCDKIGLGIIIKHLPNQYNEVISRNNSTLTFGQLQMISIARAIIQNREFLIMDEPTSNIDLYSEIKIKEVINNFRKNRSTIVIAHRLSTIYNSDMILVLDKGRIIEMGKHDKLLNNRGLYYEMFSSHFVTEEKI